MAARRVGIRRSVLQVKGSWTFSGISDSPALWLSGGRRHITSSSAKRQIGNVEGAQVCPSWQRQRTGLQRPGEKRSEAGLVRGVQVCSSEGLWPCVAWSWLSPLWMRRWQTEHNAQPLRLFRCTQHRLLLLLFLYSRRSQEAETLVHTILSLWSLFIGL